MPALNSQLILNEMKFVNNKKIAEAMAQYLLKIVVDLEPEQKMATQIRNGESPSVPFLTYKHTIINGEPDDIVLNENGLLCKLKTLVYKKQTLVKDLPHMLIYPDAFTQKPFNGMSLRSIFSNTHALDLLCTMLGPNFWVKKNYTETLEQFQNYHVVEVTLTLEFSMTPCIRSSEILALWHDASQVEVETGYANDSSYQNIHTITWPSTLEYVPAMPPLVAADGLYW